jgi:hypothetical protein
MVGILPRQIVQRLSRNRSTFLSGAVPFAAAALFYLRPSFPLPKQYSTLTMSSQAFHGQDQGAKSPLSQGGSAPSSDSVPSQFGNFRLVTGPIDVSKDYGQKGMRLVKWQSDVTGLSVVWLDHENPLVHGYFTGE